MEQEEDVHDSEDSSSGLPDNSTSQFTATVVTLIHMTDTVADAEQDEQIRTEGEDGDESTVNELITHHFQWEEVAVVRRTLHGTRIHRVHTNTDSWGRGSDHVHPEDLERGHREDDVVVLIPEDKTNQQHHCFHDVGGE